MMQIVRLRDSKQAAVRLADVLTNALKQNPAVTWLLPGGSNIAISVAAMELIPAELTSKLFLSQTDERYGPVGFADSNWQQLKDASFKFGQAKLLPFLREPQLSLEDTAEEASKVVAEIIKSSYTIGQFGMGADSHIAGIKPGSPASVASGLVVGYEWEDFTRITLTFNAIRQLNVALAFVFGESKKAMLEALENEHHQPMTSPAQILKSLTRATVYNDQIGEG